MLLSKSLAAALCLLSASTLAAAQSLPFLQRELADRSSRFLELAQPPGASPAYRAHIGSQTVTFDASGVQWVPPTSEPSSLLKGIGVHAGLSYRFEGGATNVPEVLNPSNTTYNWFVGPQSEWREGLKSFGELAYRNVWPGIDTVFKGDFKGVKYQFELARGADPARVWLRIAGAQQARIAADGALEWTVNGAVLRDAAPIAFQTVGAAQSPVTAAYRLEQVDASTWRVGFQLGAYDPQQPLVIDPAWIAFSGLVGGNSSDTVNAVALDSSGNTWACGTTKSASLGNLPASNKGGMDAFVAKFDATGGASSISYLGGTGDDSCRGLAIDSQDKIYITGGTTPTNSSLTSGSKTGTDTDIYVARLSASGQKDWATSFGGTDDDQGNAIAVDDAGRAYVTGATTCVMSGAVCSSVFPKLGGTDFNETGVFVSRSAFVARIAANGSTQEFASVVPGDGVTGIGYGIAIHPANGDVVVVGETDSSTAGLPSGVPGYRSTANARTDDGADGFAARISATGNSPALSYFTLLTGNKTGSFNADRAFAVQLLPDGSAIVGGETSADAFPTNGAGASTTSRTASSTPNMDGFVLRLSADGTNVLAAKYMGGAGYDSTEAVAGFGQSMFALANLTDTQPPRTNASKDPSANPIGKQDGYFASYSAVNGAFKYGGYLGSGTDDAFYALSARVKSNDKLAFALGGTTSGDASAFFGPNRSGLSSSAAATNGLVMLLDSDEQALAISLILNSGNAQSAKINQPLADLSVLVVDALNKAVADVRVTFSAPTTGASIAGSGALTAVSDTKGIATLSGISANAFAGTYTVTASAGAKHITFTLTNLAAEQDVLSISPISAQIPYQGSVTLTASGGSGTGVLHFAFDPTDATATSFCELLTPAGNSVTVKAKQAGGSCKVIATKDGDGNYLTQSSTAVSIGTLKAAQTTLSVSPQPVSIAVGASIALAVTNTRPNSSSTFVVDPASAAFCMIKAGRTDTVIGIAAGVCTLQVTQTGDANYLDAALSAIVTIIPATPGALVLQAPASMTYGDAPAALSVTQQVSNATVDYRVVSGSCAIENGNLLKANAVGDCMIQASQAANANYAATSSTPVKVTVNKAAQATALVLVATPATLAPAQQAVLSATGGDSNGAITYEQLAGNPSVCTLTGNTVTAVAPSTTGVTCQVRALMAGGSNYNDLYSQTITIGVANQPQAQITVSAASTSIALNATTTVTATGGSGVIKFSYALVSGATACALDTELGVVTGKAIGSCEVRASNAASPGFDAATSSNSVTISVGKAPQNITFALPAGPMVLIAPDLALTATSDVASLTVTTFASKTSAVCEVVGTTLKFYTAGTCTVTASQEGNTDYAAAEKDASVQVTLPAGTAGTVTGSIKEGPVTAEIVGGNGWTFGPQGNPNWEVTGFFPVSGEKPPANLTFPAGLFGFTAINGPKGTPVTIKLSYPITFPANAQYWKFGKTADNATAHWYQLPNATISGNTVTFTVTDGGVGDNDLLANSVIKDPGGVAVNSDTTPGIPTTANPIPTLGEYARWMLMLLVLGVGAMTLKRRES